MASHCTTENVQDYTLTARWPTELMYVLILISNVRTAPGDDSGHTYLVDKVAPALLARIPTILHMLRRLSMFAKQASQSSGAHRSPRKWDEGRSLASAEKTRRLGHHPIESVPQ